MLNPTRYKKVEIRFKIFVEKINLIPMHGDTYYYLDGLGAVDTNSWACQKSQSSQTSSYQIAVMKCVPEHGVAH